MQASRTISTWTLGVPAGAWRWAALVFAIVALGAAGLALTQPDQAGFAGYALLGGIGAVASLLLYAVWPREGLKTEDARRISEAAARANVAWAITGPDGSVLDGNPVYLAPNRFNLQVAMERWPQVGFHATREHGQRMAHT